MISDSASRVKLVVQAPEMSVAVQRFYEKSLAATADSATPDPQRLIDIAVEELADSDDRPDWTAEGRAEGLSR